MVLNIYSRIYKTFVLAGIGLASVSLIGTIGYWFIGGKRYSLMDCFYMAIITITTIGYGEIIDLSGNPAGRMFTIVIAISGISIEAFFLTNLIALIVEGELSYAFRRNKMNKIISRLKEHYIICGVGGVGFHVLSELSSTKRVHVVIDSDKTKIERMLEVFRESPFIEGDATDSDTLLASGIREAKGLLAITGDDSKNLVISLSAKQLNPNIRVVARCHDLKNMEKMKKAGADAVISPGFIGGLRMASEMVRPTVVSFLDTMLRDKEKNPRVEQITVPESLDGQTISKLDLREYPNILLLAVRTGANWIYNPSHDYSLKAGDTLIFLTTPEERTKLESVFRAKQRT
ncbi:TrkA-N domain protein [Candidatus Sulfobium mesophilum]|uniref:TrkA-N domain protein n=1 Tax=Candidatus Sulfobium mesophilum TaxID=2016548 RepID=A0A2U3QI16_9BACT|nr:TrkA-N domain protein [Candidatus Sulfobium mesophilum]